MDILRKTDFSLLCRSCMKEIESRDIENNDEKAAEMFFYCTKIEVQTSLDEYLPKNFCPNCIRTIELSYNFIKEAQKIDIALKNIVARCKTVIVKTECLKIDNSSPNVMIPDCKTSSNINDYKLTDSIDNTDYTEHDFLIKHEDYEELPEIEHSKEKVSETMSGMQKFTCPFCQKCFTSKIWFNRHVEKEQGGKFTCPHCNKAFLKSSQLSNHIVNHSQERKFECNVCGQKYKRRNQLSVHSRTHTDIRPYGCDKCDMRFKIKSVLKGHMKVHDEQKPYLCSFCGWSFSQCGNLKVHLRKHTGDKPFKCYKCGFSTSVSSNLRRHERKHSEARTHVCNLCRKTFYDATSLVKARHKRTHTGELPYKCPCCERAFVDSWKRKTHLMRTHRMSLQDIPRMTMDGKTINNRD